ncbi:hypothetical protein, partial [Streptomyces sp. SA3_actF]|uniref:hypothetical protein n=1 Tax=Streptomyces sp. SA3_actF TaxID=682181 RepID=UPI001F2C1789
MNRTTSCTACRHGSVRSRAVVSVTRRRRHSGTSRSSRPRRGRGGAHGESERQGETAVAPGLFLLPAPGVEGHQRRDARQRYARP